MLMLLLVVIVVLLIVVGVESVFVMWLVIVWVISCALGDLFVGRLVVRMRNSSLLWCVIRLVVCVVCSSRCVIWCSSWSLVLWLYVLFTCLKLFRLM